MSQDQFNQQDPTKQHAAPGSGNRTVEYGLEAMTTEQFDRVMKTNVYALFWLCKAAVPHMPPGATIITSSSI